MDRQRLHAIARRVHRGYFAGEPTAAQLDNLLEALGPKVRLALLKAAVDTGSV